MSLLGWWPTGKYEPVRRQQPRKAGELDLCAVLGGEGGHRRWIELTIGRQVCHPVEELLKPCWRDDLEDPGGLVARIPEGVPLASWLEDQVTGLAIDDFPAEVSANPPLEDLAVLVLATVPVHRCSQCPWLHRVLDKCEASTRLSVSV